MYDKNSAKQKHYFNKKKNKIGSKLRIKSCHDKKNCATKTRNKKIWLFTKKVLQNVVPSSLTEKNPSVRVWRQKNFLFCDKKALLSAVVLLSSVVDKLSTKKAWSGTKKAGRNTTHRITYIYVTSHTIRTTHRSYYKKTTRLLHTLVISHTLLY